MTDSAWRCKVDGSDLKTHTPGWLSQQHSKWIRWNQIGWSTKPKPFTNHYWKINVYCSAGGIRLLALYGANIRWSKGWKSMFATYMYTNHVNSGHKNQKKSQLTSIKRADCWVDDNFPSINLNYWSWDKLLMCIFPLVTFPPPWVLWSFCRGRIPYRSLWLAKGMFN